MAYPLEWSAHFEPLWPDVLIEREESPESTESGLIIPTRYREAVKSPVARVVRSSDPRAVPGDYVLVAEGAGRRLVFGDFEPKTVYYLVTYEQLRLRFVRVEQSLMGWREVSQNESVYRLHLPESILCVREDVVDQGLATAIGDQRQS